MDANPVVIRIPGSSEELRGLDEPVTVARVPNEPEQIPVFGTHRLRVRIRMHEQTLSCERSIDQHLDLLVGIVDECERSHRSGFEVQYAPQIVGIRK